jgi:hypothetical protein
MLTRANFFILQFLIVLAISHKLIFNKVVAVEHVIYLEFCFCFAICVISECSNLPIELKWICPDGWCISAALLCNGQSDCIDESDELACCKFYVLTPFEITINEACYRKPLL